VLRSVMGRLFMGSAYRDKESCQCLCAF
jgi:hypothetical protein